jgi:hypothetical protein
MLRFLIGGAAFLPSQLNRASPMGLDNPYPFAASAHFIAMSNSVTNPAKDFRATFAPFQPSFRF